MHLKHAVVALGVYFHIYLPLCIPCLTIEYASLILMRDFKSYGWVCVR